MARILLIDDDPALLDVVAMGLEDADHEVIRASDGRSGMVHIETDRPDIVVSDINMPALDGFRLCQQIRAAGNAVPVILLTSRDNEIDETLGLDLGADDYIVKPVSTRVLVARVAALLRREALRSGTAPAGDAARSVGPLTLDADRLSVGWREAALSVTVTEYRMLDALSRRPGVVLSRGQLLEQGRGDDSVVDGRLVDTYIRRLRRKFEAIDKDFCGIETVIGAGYRWSDAVE
jgi:DNA-binding response OmpR family regulator